MIFERILPLLAFTAAIGIFFGYINPTWTVTIAATKAAIISDEQALTAASTYMARQNLLASARDAMNPADLERLSVFLPDSVDNVGLILDLTALASRSGLSLSNIDVTKNSIASSDDPLISGALPTARTNLTGSIDLSLSAVGTYGALQAFLTEVEKSTRLLDVQDIDVKGSDTGVYNYKMKLRIFWLR